MPIKARLKGQRFLRNFKEKVLKQIDIKSNRLVRKSFVALKKATPIGDPRIWNWPPPYNYKSGMARKSWFLEFYDNVNKDKAFYSLGRMWNTTHYIQYINYGRIVNGKHQGQHGIRTPLYYLEYTLIPFYDRINVVVKAFTSKG